MQVALGEARAVAAEVMERGYGVVRCALTPSQVAVLAGEVARELAEPSEPALAESGARPVQLEDAASWPAGTQRRVFEAVPPGGAGPWSAVAESPRLRAALDELLGEGGWELPLNRPLPPGGTREDFVRHWYCPVTFPEGRGEKRPGGWGAIAPCPPPQPTPTLGRTRSAQWASQPTYSLSRCRATTARARPGRQRRMLPLRQPSRRAPAGRPLLPQCSLGGTRRCAGSGGAPRGPPRRTRGSCAAWRGWVALTPPRSSRMPLAGRRGHCCKCRRGRFTSSLRGRRMG
mmetsp:Transcript_64710/g.204300  ORF Transcript_64710/g.204300 Transcript_64710/m.204300 type:complete len:288 (-) Transcript_64710:549-1412(-)